MGKTHSDNFIDDNVATELFKAIEAMSQSFVRLRGRKCLCLGGSVTCAGLVEQDNIPDWLSGLMRSVGKFFPAEMGSLPSPNHALINVYEPGEGIMAHEDGPAYSPYAAILSLGSSTVFDFVPKTECDSRRARVYLPVGSLLLFTGEAYKDMLHEVQVARHDYIREGVCLNGERIEGCGFSSYSNGILTRGKRISITMRHVEVSR